MKAKWIALLARCIRNGAIGDSNSRTSRSKKSYRIIIHSNFIYNCRVLISFSDVIFVPRIADRGSRILPKSWKTQNAKSRAERKLKKECRRFRREFQSGRRTYIKKSVLLIWWIASLCNIRRAKKEYRRRRIEKGIEIQHMLARYKPGNHLLI